MRFLPLLLAIIWMAGTSWLFHTQKSNACCKDYINQKKEKSDKDKGDASKLIGSTAVKTSPLWFNYNEDEARMSDDFNKYRDSIVALISDKNNLRITGHYYKDEPKPEQYANLGLARGHAAKDLFKNYIDEKRIIIESNLRSGNRGEGDAFYNSVSFDEYEVDKKISTIKSSNNTGNASSPAAVEIKEILFPYGESNILNSTEVNAFLSDLAKRAIQSKEKIILTGHTDNESGSDFNYRLGLKRANKVKSILLNKRVPSGQISVLSKGEESPRASNSTEAGRQRNRRVEVVIQ